MRKKLISKFASFVSVPATQLVRTNSSAGSRCLSKKEYVCICIDIYIYIYMNSSAGSRCLRVGITPHSHPAASPSHTSPIHTPSIHSASRTCCIARAPRRCAPAAAASPRTTTVCRALFTPRLFTPRLFTVLLIPVAEPEHLGVALRQERWQRRLAPRLCVGLYSHLAHSHLVYSHPVYSQRFSYLLQSPSTSAVRSGSSNGSVASHHDCV